MMQISDNPHVQESYEQMRRAGQSHAIAEMLALRQPPADKADRTFLAGLAPRSAEENRKLAKKAERRGVSVSGATYLKSLARFNGDPEAFIRSRDDVKRVLEKRGWAAEGAVEANYLPPVDQLQAEHTDIGINPNKLEEQTRMHEGKLRARLPRRERLDYKSKLYNQHKPSDCKTPFTPALHAPAEAKAKKVKKSSK